MRLRARVGSVLVGGLLLGSSLSGSPAHAAGETNIDHVEVSDDGTVSVLLAVDGLARGALPDLDSIAVTVDGKPVKATAEPVKAGQIERTTVLAIDASLSMRGERFQAAKSAAKAFLAAAPDDVHIGLLTFSGQVQGVTAPTTDHGTLTAAIDEIQLTWGTQVYDAVIAASELAGQEGARSVLLLSDGEDEGKGAPLDEAVAAVADRQVVVDVVAVQQKPSNRMLLAQIADSSGGRVIPADDPAALEGLFTEQAQALASQVLVTIQRPPGVSDEASLSLSLDADGQTYTDTAFVPLPRASTDAGPKKVPTAEPVVGDTALWVGGAALGLGLFGLLVIVLVGSNRAPSLAQQQIAYYTGEGPQRNATSRGSAKPAGPTLRQSAVSAAQRVVKGDFETRVAQRLNGAGLALTAAEWLLLHAAIALGAAFLGLVLNGPPLMVLFLVAGAALPWVYLKHKHSRRLAAFNGQLAETLQLIAGGLSAGLSMPQAIDTVVREGHEPMSGELRRSLIEQRLGVDIEDALDGVAERMASQDFSWVVMAIRIQREVGGNLAELLDTVSDTLREREYLRRQVKVLTAEGRFSAWILGGLPVAMFVLLLFTRPDAVRPLYTEPLGLLMSLAAIVLLLGGAFTMSKLVKVEV